MRYEASQSRDRLDVPLRDLLDRKTRELEEAEARFQALFEGIPEIVLVHDAGGTIQLANKVATLELERASDELVGANLRSLVEPADGEKVLAASVRAHSHGSATFDATCVTRSGRRLELSVNCRSFDFEGRASLLSVARDTAAQRSADRQRADFMAMVAHDIRNPLSVVVGYAEMLREQGRLEPESADMLARLASNARAVISLVSNYLDLSRIEAGHLLLYPVAVEINEVLLVVSELYEDEARRKGIAFEVAPDESVPTLRSDSMALERVLANLVHNALKFTPAAGRITLSSKLEGSEVVVRVRDTGPGIRSEDVPTIFDRYRRAFAGQANHGSGLGLFIARALVETLGGTITLESNSDGGCCFAIRLPVGE